MTNAPHEVPARVSTLERGGLVVGLAALVLSLLGGLQAPDQFFRSYLLAFLFFVGLSVGSLAVLMIQHLTGGAWGLVIRRPLEAATRVLPLLVVAFLPLLLGLRGLFVWTHPERVAADPVLQHQSPYLNLPFFLARSAFYLLAWAVMAHLLSRWSREQDTRPSAALGARLRALSGGGLVLVAMTITFASVDWAMSLDPHWFSTLYGVIFMVGWALAALAFAVVVLTLLASSPPLERIVKADHVHDLGKLLLAFVMLWAYMAFSQLLIVWSGNLPEEIPWYLQRLHGGWEWVALGLVLFHFVLPFLMLLSRDLKRRAGQLGLVAFGVLVMRFVDLYWLVGPSLQGHGAEAGLHVHWLDLLVPLALGGLWVFYFARQLRSRPLLPLGEPGLQELLAGAAAPGGEA
jgi:uncharacterized membrane protein YciS (DUF1049 family)